MAAVYSLLAVSVLRLSLPFATHRLSDFSEGLTELRLPVANVHAYFSICTGMPIEFEKLVADMGKYF